MNLVDHSWSWWIVVDLVWYFLWVDFDGHWLILVDLSWFILVDHSWSCFCDPDWCNSCYYWSWLRKDLPSVSGSFIKEKALYTKYVRDDKFASLILWQNVSTRDKNKNHRVHCATQQVAAFCSGRLGSTCWYQKWLAIISWQDKKEIVSSVIPKTRRGRPRW